MSRIHAHVMTVILIASAGLGCATWPGDRILQPHITIDYRGRALTDELHPIARKTLPKTVDDEILPPIMKYIDARRREGEKARLLIYIHGGLTSAAEGLKYIQDMIDIHPADLTRNRFKGTDLYPIFIVWDASFANAVWDDLVEIRRGERMESFWGLLFGAVTSPIVGGYRLVSSVIKAPLTIWYLGDISFTKTIIEKGKPDEPYLKMRRANDALTTAVTLPSKILLVPFIGGFGTPAWEMMKRRIDQMFAPPPREGVVQVLLEKLAEKLQSSEYQDHIEITLAGHSMGAIVVNHILREFPKMRFRRIVYMGAAASVDDFRDTLIPYLTQHDEAQFSSFSLASRNESGEVAGEDFLPRGSLLVWIDEIFEPGYWVGQRRIGWWRTAKRASVDPKVCSRMVFFKFVGMEQDPQKHGEFNDDVKLQKILNIAGKSWQEDCSSECARHEDKGNFRPCMKSITGDKEKDYPHVE